MKASKSGLIFSLFIASLVTLFVYDAFLSDDFEQNKTDSGIAPPDGTRVYVVPEDSAFIGTIITEPESKVPVDTSITVGELAAYWWRNLEMNKKSKPDTTAVNHSTKSFWQRLEL